MFGLPTSWIIGGVLALVVGGYVWHCESVKADRARMDGIAQEQQKNNAILALRQQKQRELADEEYSRRIADLTKRLHQPRPSVLPAAPAGAEHPELACFDRPELDAAIGRFVERATGIAEKGDEATIGLDVAKRWAQAL